MLFINGLRQVLVVVFLLMFTSSQGSDETSPDFWYNVARDQLRRAKDNQPIMKRAKNIILFIGDGMGVSTVTAARILKGQLQGHTGEEALLSFEEFPHVAFSKTYSIDFQTTDSAATATALLSGVKTNRRNIGVDGRVTLNDCEASKRYKVNSVLDWALESGKSAGIVTTARVTHATPAAAYAHVPNREWEADYEMDSSARNCKDIADQLVTENPEIQVIMGGGRRHFLNENTPDPESGSIKDHRKDGRDLIQEWIQEKKRRRVRGHYVWNATSFHSIDPSSTDYLLGLFSESHMQYEVDRKVPSVDEAGEPSLAEMTEKALKILQKNDKGFFLLVEGARIDHGHHANRATRALHETLALQDAVTKATEMTNIQDTLIIVTADHSHVFVIAGYQTRGNPILGAVDIPRETFDNRPYTTLLYGNGPGYSLVNNTREDISGKNTADKDYRQQSAVPMRSETHGGEDVQIFAQGPYAHLFHSVHEQHYVAHVMAYSACLGPYSGKEACEAGSTAAKDCPINNAVSVTWSSLLVPVVILSAVMDTHLLKI